MLKRPLPCGPRSTDPSRITASSGTDSDRTSSRMAVTSDPVASLTDGCQIRLMPNDLSSSNQPDCPDSRTAMVQPPQLAPCSQRILNGEWGVRFIPACQFPDPHPGPIAPCNLISFTLAAQTFEPRVRHSNQRLQHDGL